MQAIVLNREIAQGIFCDRALREELIKLLNALIDEELRKTDDEADFDLIDAYSEALNDLYGENGTLHVIRKLQTADAFLARVSEDKKWQSINRAVKAGLAVCAALAFLVTANTVTEKATGVNVLGRAAEAVRNIFVGQEREPIITLPPETERAVTERVSEVASETTAQETEKESTGEPSAAASAVGQTQPNRSPTTTGAQSTVKPKNPNLQQVLSPEDPPTTKAHETTTRKPFERTSSVTWSRSFRLSMLRVRLSVSGKSLPMSPRPAAPKRASISAWVAASASEWPSSPSSQGISTPPSTSRLPGASLCTS